MHYETLRDYNYLLETLNLRVVHVCLTSIRIYTVTFLFKFSNEMPVYHHLGISFFFLLVALVMRNTWPSGSYGLPKPKSGCPSKEWLEGFRYQDSENVENTNTKTNGSHFSGRVTPHGIRQEFCIHKDTPGKRIPWPSGKYCIYRKGNSCPTGLREGDSHMKGHHPT